MTRPRTPASGTSVPWLEPAIMAASVMAGTIVAGLVWGRYAALFVAVMQGCLTLWAYLRAFERARIQEQESRLRFLAALRHEISTPTTSIVHVTDQLLVGEGLSQVQMDRIRSIHTSTRSLAATVGDLLDRTGDRRKPLGPAREEFRLRRCIQEPVELLFPLASEKNLEFTYLVEPSLPYVLRGDDVRLGRVLRNLIREAIERTSSGSVSLCAAWAEDSKPDGRIRFDIRFTGQAPSHEDEGQIALSICHELTQGLGGAMGFTQDAGGGSIWFTACFQVCESDQDSDHGIEELQGVRLLVVEQTEAVREIARTYAESWLMDVEVASSAVQGMRLLRERAQEGRPFNVALLDDGMPGMGGREMAALIKGDNRLRQTSLIQLTPLGEHLHPGQLSRDGFEAWITKPLGQRKLRTALVHVVSETELNSGSDGAGAGEGAGAGVRLCAQVLLVEDNVVNQKVASMMLRKLGCKVEVAHDGLEAVQFVRSKQFDIVFMDCQMPVKSGYDATREIRAFKDPGLKQLPIIAMTADAMPGDRERCLEAGMSDYLPKPVQSADLGTMLTKWVKEEAHEQNPSEIDMSENHDHEVLDQSVIEGLKELGGEDDPELFSELVNLFLDDTPTRISDLQQALTSSDAGSLERAAHALKSSAANLGAMHLSELFRQIEMAGKDSDIDNARSLVDRSCHEFDRVTSALKAQLD